MSSPAWREANQEKLRQYRRDHYHKNAAYYKAQVKKYQEAHGRWKEDPGVAAERQRKRRANPNKRPQIIVVDCRANDRRHGRSCDLDVDFVQEKISKGCLYCGCTEAKMSLDRIDNNLGHLKTNVNPTCLRCNHIRSNMPYEAWMMIVPAIRVAHEQGLFGDWRQR